MSQYDKQKRICVICEGFEEHDYFEKLKQCNVFDDIYKIKCKNAKSIDNISAVYQSQFQDDSNDLVVIFCDTEMSPYDKYERMKHSIDMYHDAQITQDIVFFANPCTMQIILSHFNKVNLTSNSKTINSKTIEQLTGVKDYEAKENQRHAIVRKITKTNYSAMKKNLASIKTNYKVVPSTNFLDLINKLEQSNTEWINNIVKKYYD